MTGDGDMTNMNDHWCDIPNDVNDRRRDDSRVVVWTTDDVMTAVRGVCVDD